MVRHKTSLIVAFIVLGVAASACKPRSPLDAAGIRKWAKAQGYGWVEGPDEIRTEQAFFDTIDGGAEPIIDLGWKRSLYGVLSKGESRLRLTLHEMTDSRAAAALFEQNVFKDTEPIALGDRAFYWDRGAFSRGIFFQKGDVVCELSLEKGGDKEAAVALASSLEARIE